MALRQDALASPRSKVEDTDAIPWVVDGLISGLLGSLTVALLFLARDLTAGWPLWTPSALGAAVFRGETMAQIPEPELAMVAAYSVMHGAVFLGIGLIAAFVTETSARLSAHAVRTTAFMTLGLFVCFQAVFMGLAAVLGRPLLGELGSGWVAGANFAAALVMAAFLAERAHLRLEG